jgi:hypothetical protein
VSDPDEPRRGGDSPPQPDVNPWAPPDPSAPPGWQGGDHPRPWGQQPPGQQAWGQAQWGQQPPAQPPWGRQPPAQPPWGRQPPAQPQWGQQPPGQPQWGPQPWGWAPPPPDPARQRRRRLLAFGSLATVVLLLLGTLGAVAYYESGRTERVRAEVAALLPDLQAFVAEQRGLAFLQPVEVEVLGDSDFLDALYAAEEAVPEPAEDTDPEPTLKALGLLEEDADLEAQVGEALDGGVLGFYDPASDRLVVRGRSLDAVTEMIIVHELVHALQDQHFDLDRPELDEADDERGLAFAALVEGDASRIERAWYDQLSYSRRQEIDRQIGPLQSGSPDVVEALLGFPYYAGPAYVEALLQRGGQDALDAAFAEPPTTTEQVLRPSRTGDVAEVPRPEPGGDVLDEGVLGLLGLHLMLQFDPMETGGGIDSWNGDRYVTYQDGDRACTLAHIAVDDEYLSLELQSWRAEVRPDVEVGIGPAGTVRLLACT